VVTGLSTHALGSGSLVPRVNGSLRGLKWLPGEGQNAPKCYLRLVSFGQESGQCENPPGRDGPDEESPGRITLSLHEAAACSKFEKTSKIALNRGPMSRSLSLDR
jgi:hypothetical protein